MSFLSPTLRMENLSTQPIMSLDHVPEAQRYNKQNIMYRIELEHGTTSGRRMIWVNGREVLRRDWMFKLVGEDTFQIEESRCIIRVDPAPGFKYEYSLYIDGKPHAQYTEELTRKYRLWLCTCGTTEEYRIMLKLDTLSLYVNDELREEQAAFVNGGTDTTFMLQDTEFILQARSSGNKHDGIVHTLLVNGELVPEAKIQEIMQEQVSILQTT
ncbi:CG10257 [Drosophila busckii]|uniref:CG10257 n=1 Tax=Drosophila busckii TaxID=30019 RepID=A0A0M4EDU0_DROBS|nr:CG10257 [Drosophila busckii]